MILVLLENISTEYKSTFKVEIKILLDGICDLSKKRLQLFIVSRLYVIQSLFDNNFRFIKFKPLKQSIIF